MKIWKKTRLLLASKDNEGIIIKSKIFPVIMLNSNFKMVYYIVMVFYMFMIFLRNFKFSKLNTMLWL
jgi:hypothetical protein